MPEDMLRDVQRAIKQEIVPDDMVKKQRSRVNLLENRLKNIVIRKIV